MSNFNPTKEGLTETLGINFISTQEAEVVVDQRHVRPGGIANGSLSLSLIESVASVACCSSIDFANYNALGISVTANHLRPALLGDRLTAKAFAIHSGRSTQVWEVEIKNQDQKLVSSGRITMMVVPRK